MDKRMRVNAPQVIHETIDGEVIVINLGTGNYYSLKGSGADVWQLVEKSPTESEIIAALEERYGSNDGIGAGVAAFVAQLREEELVTDAAEGSAPAADWQPAAQEFEAPRLEKFTDMQDLVLLDPVHEVDATGWPQARPDDQPVSSPGA